MTFVVINLNVTKKAECFYYAPSFTIDCILIFFSPVFKVYFDRFLKRFVFKIAINTFLKYIDSDLVIVIVTHGNF